MRYILQNNSDSLDIEYIIIKNILKRNKYVFDYIDISNGAMEYAKEGDVPIGDIPFVTQYINKIYGITQENPIEIPDYLRTDEFLKRDYSIVTWDKLPDKGNWFIKDVSQLKKFGSEINLDYQNIKDWFNKPTNNFGTQLVLDKEHLFQVSSVYNIQSEYRVYIINGEIEAICNYNGDPTILLDISLLKKAVSLINYNEKWLKSYTIDLMVGPKGTAIIEIHNFSSVGLYNTLWGNNLIYAYRDGIDYLINDNKQIKL